MSSPLLTIDLLSVWTRHPKETLRTWVKRRRILPVACDVKSRAHLFDAKRTVELVGVRDDPGESRRGA